MKNPRRLPGILDVTYQTLPERELFWNLGIPGIFLSWSGNSSAFSRIWRGRFQKSSKLQKNSRSGRVWSVTSRITGKGRGFFIILYKHFLQCIVGFGRANAPRKIDKFPETNYGEKIPIGGKSGRNCSATTDVKVHKLLPPRVGCVFFRWTS